MSLNLRRVEERGYLQKCGQGLEEIAAPQGGWCGAIATLG